MIKTFLKWWHIKKNEGSMLNFQKWQIKGNVKTQEGGLNWIFFLFGNFKTFSQIFLKIKFLIQLSDR